MIWLLNDFDLLSLLLHAVVLALESLVVGGAFFLLLAALPAGAPVPALAACRRAMQWAALSLVVAILLSIVLSVAILVGNDIRLRDALCAGPLLAQTSAAGSALLLFALSRRDDRTRAARVLLFCAAAGVMTALVALSHAAAQMQHRAFLLALTGAHHLGTAAWVGAMPYLLASLRRIEDVGIARRLVRRYSAMALAGAAALAAAGLGLAWVYVGTAQGLYGTTYGVLVLVKACLLCLMLLLGGANWWAVRALDRSPHAPLLRVRRFAEVEFGLGIMAILVAASLTAQSPAVDVQQGRLSWNDIEARLRWEPPRLKSPPLSTLAPPSSLEEAVQARRFTDAAESDANDRAWSEYNHHWAGLIVLVAGLLAFASRFRRLRWARLWPLSFAGLALFTLLRADPENWPLGPRSFWGSFFAPDVLEHRAAALLILCFAGFEGMVHIGRLQSAWARYAFPGMCVLGGALLLTHTHSSTTGRDELLAEITHSALAVCAAIAGWSRWLELRLPPGDGRQRRIAGYLWPLALILAAVLLLDYREF